VRRETDRLKRLLEEYKQAYDSDKNKSKLKLFSPVFYDVKEKFRYQPARVDSIKRVPILSYTGMPFWAELFGFSLKDYYTKPEVYLEYFLKSQLFYFNEIDDDNALMDIIPIWLAEGFEATLFGMEQFYFDDVNPSLGTQVLIKNKSDFKKIKRVDFYNSGLMPLAHQFYEFITSMLEPFELKAGFPPWFHSPVHMVIYLRGFENALIDIIEDPDFFSEVIDFVTDEEIAYLKERVDFIGLKKAPKPTIADDYVSKPNFRPDMYKNFIFDSEKKLSNEFGGISYWHNCGDATPYLDYVKELPGIDMIHSGPFTPFEETVKRFSNTSIELHLKPKEECMDLSAEGMETVLRNKIRIAKKYNAASFLIRVTVYRSNKTEIIKDIDLIKKWTSVSKKVKNIEY
jgi:uroporphyrinogen-III decarboxylase